MVWYQTRRRVQLGGRGQLKERGSELANGLEAIRSPEGTSGPQSALRRYLDHTIDADGEDDDLMVEHA